MKKTSLKNSKTRRLLSGKGFYAALCASVVTVGAAGYFTYRQTAQRLEDQLSSPSASSSSSSSSKTWGYEDLDRNQSGREAALSGETADVNAAVSGVAKDSQTESSEAEATVNVVPEPLRQKKETENQPIITPLKGEILQPFSDGALVKSKTLNAWKTHDGVDIAGKLGDTVVAITGGAVTAVEEDPLWGVVVTIDHGNGYEARYCGLNKVIPVKVDQKVSAGTVIGAIGNTAECELKEDSHLHFGLKKDGKWIDPLSVFDVNS